MKKISKLLGIVLIIALVMSMGIMTAFAAGEYQITITNENTNMSIAGKTYSAYKVFDLTYSDADNDGTPDAYAYSIKNTDWAWATLTAGATTAADGKITTTYGIVLTPSATDSTLYSVDGKTMTEANARALADKLAKTTLPTAAGTVDVPANAQTATIKMDEPGYYAVYGVVYSTDPYYDGSDAAHTAPEVVAALGLTTTDPTVTVKPKASVPPLNKKITGVSEDTVTVNGAVLDTAGQAAVAKVGSAIHFQVDSLTPDLTGYDDYTYIIGDSISAGLTYVKNTFVLKINDQVVTPGTGTDDVKLVFGANDSSFTLTIPYAVLKAAGTGKTVVLTYDCVVNSNAVKYDHENNTASLEYSKTPYENETNHTPEKETYVIDLNIDVDKVAENASGKKLSGAQFKLYRETSTGGVQYYKWDTTNNVVTWVGTRDAGDTFTTGSDGKLTTQVQGLDVGTYYLEETKAPEGYNVLADPVKVTITATESESSGVKTVSYTATVDGVSAAVDNGNINLGPQQKEAQPVANAMILNKSGTVLPSTGGIGTTIFYVVGSILVVAAGVLLITKKRMSREG